MVEAIVLALLVVLFVIALGWLTIVSRGER